MAVVTLADALCPDETRDPGQVPGKEALSVHYESYEKLEYTLKDGTVKEKKDFVSKTVPFSVYKAKFVEYYPKFVAHHNDAKWHDDDFISLKSKLPRCHCGLVIDYAENYSHEPREEHQSKYFSQVGTPFTHACMHSQTCFQLLFHCMHAFSNLSSVTPLVPANGQIYSPLPIGPDDHHPCGAHV